MKVTVPTLLPSKRHLAALHRSSSQRLMATRKVAKECPLKVADSTGRLRPLKLQKISKKPSFEGFAVSEMGSPLGPLLIAFIFIKEGRRQRDFIAIQASNSCGNVYRNGCIKGN